MSADTIVPRPSDPQSFNRYAALGNSPLTYRDPTGHAEISFEGVTVDDVEIWLRLGYIDKLGARDYLRENIFKYDRTKDYFASHASNPEWDGIVGNALAQAAADAGDTANVIYAMRAGGNVEWDTSHMLVPALAGLVTLGEIKDLLPQRSGNKTQGILVADGQHYQLTSGKRGPASEMPFDTPGMRKDMVVRDHVEAHAAAIMRQQSMREADLLINRSPCSGSRGCDSMLPHMLPEGAILRVHVLTVDGNWQSSTYVGLPDSQWSWP